MRDLVPTPSPGCGTTAPPQFFISTVTPVRSQVACATVTGSCLTTTVAPGWPHASRNSGGTPEMEGVLVAGRDWSAGAASPPHPSAAMKVSIVAVPTQERMSLMLPQTQLTAQRFGPPESL